MNEPTQPLLVADDYCVDCRAPLRHPLARNFGICIPCMDKWRALAVLGTPSRIHPTDAAQAAAHGASADHELRQIGPEPSDALPDPAKWIDMVASGDIPPHDGRRCPECGYPLTEAHVWRDLWWLCPVCDSVANRDGSE